MIPEYTTKIISIDEVARDTKQFIFSKPTDWNYKAGQFLSLKFTERAFRAYSIASHPDEKNIELVVRLIAGGIGSTVLGQSNIGDEFIFRGAFGHFGLTSSLREPQGSQPEAIQTPLYFCATGTGIAPFRGMILDEMKQKNPRPMTLLYGGRNTDDIAYLDAIRTWSPHLKVCIALSREPDQNILDTCAKKIDATVIKGRITDFLVDKKIVCHPALDSGLAAKPEFYICGNGDMVMSVRKILLEQDVDKSQIIQERFN